jgi:hypothetical protein
MNPKHLNYSDKEYESFVRKQPCLICKYPVVDLHHWDHARRNSYMGVPLCRNHHTMNPDSYHRLEMHEFERRHNIEGAWEIIKLLSQYIQETSYLETEWHECETKKGWLVKK